MKHEMKRGLYVIFEGDDMVGKSTTMKIVASSIRKMLKDIIDNLVIRETSHPGSTSLGKHLRRLIRHPEELGQDIEIDHLSRQVLYLADTVSFIKSILEPALVKKEIVFADRSSFISGLAFGCADGIPIEEINRLYSVVVPPKADRLYVLRCPPDVARARMSTDNRKQDRYDKLGDAFHQRVNDIYDGLATGPAERIMLVSRCVSLDNIVYVDASFPQHTVVDYIVADLIRVLSERERFDRTSVYES